MQIDHDGNHLIILPSGNYKVQLYDPRTNGFAPSSPEIGMHVEIRDPDDKIILSKVYSSEGRWTFTSHTPGEHVICLYTNSTKWFSGTQLVRRRYRQCFNLMSLMSLSFSASTWTSKSASTRSTTPTWPRRRSCQSCSCA